MEEKWGFKVRNANFGLSEVLSILGGQSERTNDLLFHAGDVVFAEIIDPADARSACRSRRASTGELVCTHLRKRVPAARALPLAATSSR